MEKIKKFFKILLVCFAFMLNFCPVVTHASCTEDAYKSYPYVAVFTLSERYSSLDKDIITVYSLTPITVKLDHSVDDFYVVIGTSDCDKKNGAPVVDCLSYDSQGQLFPVSSNATYYGLNIVPHVFYQRFKTLTVSTNHDVLNADGNVVFHKAPILTEEVLAPIPAETQGAIPIIVGGTILLVALVAFLATWPRLLRRYLD